ncbi:MAG: hypothetical protein LBL59_08120 [Xanthomonadaceae bacterium]|nr:hypothetical protein [Xanthomonadaceae bacterium]
MNGVQDDEASGLHRRLQALLGRRTDHPWVQGDDPLLSQYIQFGELDGGGTDVDRFQNDDALRIRFIHGGHLRIPTGSESGNRRGDCGGDQGSEEN